MKSSLKRILDPIRTFGSRSVKTAETVDITVEQLMMQNTIFWKASTLIAAEKVAGDYLEFGVYSGTSFIQAYRILKSVFDAQVIGPARTEKDIAEIKVILEQMRFFAFDSFLGLPPITGIDNQGRDFTEGKYSSGQAAFIERLAKENFPLDKLVIIPGWFEETCTDDTIKRYKMEKAALIHLDCDLYLSAKQVLNFIKPLIRDGTIIVFDDWYSFCGNPNLGEQKAFSEWKATMPQWTFSEYQKEGPWRNSFIANYCGPAQ